MNTKDKSQLKVMTGNAAAAIGATLARPDVVAAYPITPQTEIIEQLSKFHANDWALKQIHQLKHSGTSLLATTNSQPQHHTIRLVVRAVREPPYDLDDPPPDLVVRAVREPPYDQTNNTDPAYI